VKQDYYQVSNSNARYVRRWMPNYMRRVYRDYVYTYPNRFTHTSCVGFKQDYEYGYCLGVF
jgi:hypothetical protein